MIFKKASLSNQVGAAPDSPDTFGFNYCFCVLIYLTDMLKEILDEDIRESPEEFEQRLSVLTKEQLIAEMLRRKVSFADIMPQIGFSQLMYIYLL
jgi:hypothetical protein